MKYEINVYMKAFNQNKAMEHRIMGVLENLTKEFKVAKLHIEWSKLYNKAQLPN